VLSYKYWQTRHGGNPNIVGKVFQMNNRPHTVIGVLPAIPQYPTESDVYMPTSQCPFRSSQAFIQNRQARLMNAFGRLKPGMPLKQAQADLSTIASQLEKAYPDVYPKGSGYAMAAAPLRDDLTRRARTTFLVLLGAAGFVLLIACANVANLLLARLLKLERELAVRAALGASKTRLVRQLLTESLLLSVCGGVLGLALAPPAVTLLAKFAEHFTTRAAEVRIDAPVLLFTTAVSVLTGLLFGLAPAFSSGRHVSEALKQGSGRTTASPDPDRLLTLRLTPNFSRYSTNDQFVTLWHDVLRRISRLGALESAALASNFPFNPSGIASGLRRSARFQQCWQRTISRVSSALPTLGAAAVICCSQF
jgi:putative ABC transport system permease protein